MKFKLNGCAVVLLGVLALLIAVQYDDEQQRQAQLAKYQARRAKKQKEQAAYDALTPEKQRAWDKAMRREAKKRDMARAMWTIANSWYYVNDYGSSTEDIGLQKGAKYRLVLNKDKTYKFSRSTKFYKNIDLDDGYHLLCQGIFTVTKERDRDTGEYFFQTVCRNWWKNQSHYGRKVSGIFKLTTHDWDVTPILETEVAGAYGVHGYQRR